MSVNRVEEFRRISDVNNFLLIETPILDERFERNEYIFWSTVLICKLILIPIILNTIARLKLFYVAFHPKLVLIDGRRKDIKVMQIRLCLGCHGDTNQWMKLHLHLCSRHPAFRSDFLHFLLSYIDQDNLPDEAIQDHAKRINKSRGWRDVLRNIVESYAWFRALNKVNSSRVS